MIAFSSWLFVAFAAISLQYHGSASTIPRSSDIFDIYSYDDREPLFPPIDSSPALKHDDRVQAVQDPTEDDVKAMEIDKSGSGSGSGNFINSIGAFLSTTLRRKPLTLLGVYVGLQVFRNLRYYIPHPISHTTPYTYTLHPIPLGSI